MKKSYAPANKEKYEAATKRRLEMQENGATFEDIQEAEGVTRGGLMQWYRAKGIKRPPHRPLQAKEAKEVTPTSDETVIKAYKAGNTLEQIRNMYSMKSTGQVKAILNRAGVYKKPSYGLIDMERNMEPIRTYMEGNHLVTVYPSGLAYGAKEFRL